jgi:hypothetical protein
MEYAIILVVNNACWLLFLFVAEKRKPRYNSKAGQFILEETEDINGHAGKQKYCIEQARLHQIQADKWIDEAEEIADIMQVKANHAKNGIKK